MNPNQLTLNGSKNTMPTSNTGLNRSEVLEFIKTKYNLTDEEPCVVLNSSGYVIFHGPLADCVQTMCSSLEAGAVNISIKDIASNPQLGILH
jgi:hypothetical protein